MKWNNSLVFCGNSIFAEPILFWNTICVSASNVKLLASSYRTISGVIFPCKSQPQNGREIIINFQIRLRFATVFETTPSLLTLPKLIFVFAICYIRICSPVTAMSWLAGCL